MNFLVFIQFLICLETVYSKQIRRDLEGDVISVSPTNLEVSLPMLSLLRKNLPIRKSEPLKGNNETSNDATTTTSKPRDFNASNSTKQDLVPAHDDVLNEKVIPSDQIEPQNAWVVQPEASDVYIIESYQKQNVLDHESVPSSSVLDALVTKPKNIESKEIHGSHSENQNQSLDSLFTEKKNEQAIRLFDGGDPLQTPSEDQTNEQEAAQTMPILLEERIKPHETGKRKESLLSGPVNIHQDIHSSSNKKKTAPLQSTNVMAASKEFSTMLQQIINSLHTSSSQTNPWIKGVPSSDKPTSPFSANVFGTHHSAKTYPFDMGNGVFSSTPSTYEDTKRIQSRNSFYKPRPSIEQDDEDTLPETGFPKTDQSMRSKREFNQIFSKNSNYYVPLAELLMQSKLGTTSMIPATWIGSPKSSMAVTGGPQFSYLPPSKLYLPPYRIDDTNSDRHDNGNEPIDTLATRRVYGSIYMDDPQKRTSAQLTARASCRCGVRIAERVLGGTSTVISKHPWMAQLRLIYFNSAFICGGTIISDRYVMTAAHCFDVFSPKEVFIKLGASKSDDPNEGQNFEIEDVIIHERSKNVLRYDIALVKLAVPIQFSPTMLPICLPSARTNAEEGIITGWGSTKVGGDPSPELQEASVKVYDNRDCDKISNYPTEDLPNSILCAREDRRVSSCQGDSGGPLALDSPSSANVYQMGITSWGAGCGNYRFPGVYTKVTSYLRWIQRNTRDSTYCSASG